MARAYSSLVLVVASAGIFAAKSARALEVVTPSEGLIVVADRSVPFCFWSHFGRGWWWPSVLVICHDRTSHCLLPSAGQRELL